MSVVAHVALRGRQLGLSYVEVLVAVMILSVALVPALDTLYAALHGGPVAESAVQFENRLATRMESLLAEPFGALDAAALAAGSETTPSSYSDAAGTADRVLVFLSRYGGDDADGNGNPFDGTDAGLLWVSVAIEGTPAQLTTLIRQ